MTSRLKNRTFAALITASLLAIFSTVQAAPYFIDNSSDREYFLPGTLEEKSDFNFNISPGNKAESKLTFVNRTTLDKKYSLAAVDSEINNQQHIVFKNVSDPTNVINTWIAFDQTNINVPAGTAQIIPFTINVPADTYPGSYYGGISITHGRAEQDDNTPAPSFGVTVQSRNVVALTINVAGTVLNDYRVTPFGFLPDEKVYTLTINNDGNVLMSFEGKINVTTNSPFAEPKVVELSIPQFRMLPGTSITKKIEFSDVPFFGELSAQLEGELKAFNGIKNEYELITQIKEGRTDTVFSWPLVYGFTTILAILILVLSLSMYSSRKYLKECTNYQVEGNETLIEIAEKHQMNWKKLARINSLRPPYSLKPNQKLLVHVSKKNKS